MKMTLQPPFHSQSGVALLTILLLVVAIVVVTGSMLASQRVMLREYQLTQSQSQMQQSAQLAEANIIQMLVKDNEINQTDSPQDIWAKPLPSQTLNGANVQMTLIDESSLFNINNLYHNGTVDKSAMAYFQALLTANGIEPSVAEAVLDWQDPDSDMTGDGGAEADYYQSLGKPMPIAIANQPFTAVHELLYVRGMDKEKLQKIQPLLTVTPFFLPMNVNTIKPELLSVISLVNAKQNNTENSQPANNASAPTSTPTADNQNQPSATAQGSLDVLALTDWANSRNTAMPIETVDSVWQIPAMSGVSDSQKQVMTTLLDVQSGAFGLKTVVKIDEKQRVFRSQLAKIQPPQSDNPSQATQQSTQQTSQIVVFNRQVLPFS